MNTGRSFAARIVRQLPTHAVRHVRVAWPIALRARIT